MLLRFATPVTKEKKTIGTTSILIVFKNISPPKLKKSIKMFLISGSMIFKLLMVIPINTPEKKPIKIFFVIFLSIMVPSTGYAPVAESYQDPVLLLN